MANDITQNPLYIDTAATIAFNRPLLAKRIDWIGPATLANVCVIADIGGDLLCQGYCSVVNKTVNLWQGPQKLTLPGKSGNPNGSWQVSTIQSGILLVWF
jgi:hypothetical protein